MPEQTDAELIAAVALNEDHAWAELIRRHAALVYSLSLRILGNPADAEDAGQETFIRIRQSSATFHSHDNALGWIATIASRTALKMLIQKRKRTERDATAYRQMEQMRIMQEDAVNSSGTDESKIAALRQAVDRLPSKFRLPVVLHYAGTMSLTDIAAELQCDRTSVAYRLRQGLKILKAELKKQGYSPAIVATALPMSVFVSEVAPPALIKRLSNLDGLNLEPASVSATHSVKAAGISSTKMALAGGLVFIAAGAAAWFAIERYASPNDPASNGTAARQIVVPRTMAPNQDEPLNFDWDFKRGLPPGAEVVYSVGEWKTVEFGKTTGLVISDGSRMGFSLPVKLPPRPVVVRVKLRYVIMKNTCVKVALAAAETFVQHQAWHRMVSLPKDVVERGFWTEAYFYDDVSVQTLHGLTAVVRKYPRLYPGDRLVFVGDNTVVERMEIRAIEKKDIPAHLLDSEKLIKDLNVAPTAFDAQPMRQAADAARKSQP